MPQAYFSRSALVAAAAVALAVVGGTGSALSADKDSVVATVDGRSITSVELGFITDELGPRLANMPEERKKTELLNALVDLDLVAAAAEKQGLGKSNEFKQQMDYLKRKALRNEFFRINVDEKITDADLKAVYDEQIGSIKGKEQVKARHILVKEEAEARAIIAELDKGADFAKLAKEKSTGPSGAQGGDLGYFDQSRMVPAFGAAAFSMDVGTYSKDPVKTQFGWHVILVEDKREEPKPTFDQVKDNIRGFVAQQKFSKLLEDIKAKAKVEIVK